MIFFRSAAGVSMAMALLVFASTAHGQGGIQSGVVTERSSSCTLARPLLPRLGVTPLEWPVKREKVWAREREVPRRVGREMAAVTLFNVHSREAVPLFLEAPLPDKALQRLTACRGFGEQRILDPRLFEAAIHAAQQFKVLRAEVLSGYRSPKFNDTLAKKGRGVASESRHTRGEALDLRLAEVPATRFGAWISEHFEGGVGVYDKDDFVHVDVGPKRQWRGH